MKCGLPPKEFEPMDRSIVAGSRRSILLSLGCLSVISAISVLPFAFGVEAVRKSDGKGLFVQGRSHQEELPNYDIRSDKGAFEKIAAFRSALNRSASEVANKREDLLRGESALKAKVPNLKVEYGREIFTPEIIGTDVTMGRAVLAKATRQTKSRALIGFLKQNKGLIGATDEQLDGLELFADYKNPDGNLGFVEYTQKINGIPVFRGAIRGSYSKDGELFRVVNNFAPGLDYASLSGEFNDPAEALAAASRHINYELPAGETAKNAARSSEMKTQFGEGDWSPIAEKVYFPTETGVAIPAWRVIIWQPVRGYMVIVDAESGELLWRKNVTEDQTQQATYDVYTNSQAMINVADSPAPASPTILDPGLGIQGLPLLRNTVVRVGNEAPYN